MVAKLMPHVAPEATADNVALARFDYSQLDEEAASVRLRLNSTVIGLENTDKGVAVTYASSTGKLRTNFIAARCVGLLSQHHSLFVPNNGHRPKGGPQVSG